MSDWEKYNQAYIDEHPEVILMSPYIYFAPDIDRYIVLDEEGQLLNSFYSYASASTRLKLHKESRREEEEEEAKQKKQKEQEKDKIIVSEADIELFADYASNWVRTTIKAWGALQKEKQANKQ
jgi:NACalpha-BTF3-like transcription factor